MPYKVVKGKRNVLDESFGTAKAAKIAKYQIIIGGKSFKDAAPFLDTKIVKFAKAKKKK